MRTLALLLVWAVLLAGCGDKTNVTGATVSCPNGAPLAQTTVTTGPVDVNCSPGTTTTPAPVIVPPVVVAPGGTTP